MPDHNLVPLYFDENPDNPPLTLNIVAKELASQSGTARGDHITSGSRLSSWRFLMPNEVRDTTSHSWEEYESVGTRLAQKSANIAAGVRSSEQLGGSSWDAIRKEVETDGEIDASRGLGLLSQMTSQDITEFMNYRIDSVLIYKKSNRRQYEFSIPLVYYDSSMTSEKIFNAVRKLQELSCAEYDENALARIKFPAIFKVSSKPYALQLVNIEYAALQSVQVTYQSPFHSIGSNRVDLHLSFIDIEPLYRKSYNNGSGVVRTS